MLAKISIIAIACAIVGCGSGYVATGTTVSGGGYSSYGYDPPLVEVQSGVWVVEGYEQPVFYSDDYYWMYRDNVWYRSSYYDRGFVVVNVVPYRLRTIDRPYAYVRFRGNIGARVRRGPRGTVYVRDREDYNRGFVRDNRVNQREQIERRQDMERRQRDQIERQRLEQQRQEDRDEMRRAEERQRLEEQRAREQEAIERQRDRE